MSINFSKLCLISWFLIIGIWYSSHTFEFWNIDLPFLTCSSMSVLSLILPLSELKLFLLLLSMFFLNLLKRGLQKLRTFPLSSCSILTFFCIYCLIYLSTSSNNECMLGCPISIILLLPGYCFITTVVDLWGTALLRVDEVLGS